MILKKILKKVRAKKKLLEKIILFILITIYYSTALLVGFYLFLKDQFKNDYKYGYNNAVNDILEGTSGSLVEDKYEESQLLNDILLYAKKSGVNLKSDYFIVDGESVFVDFEKFDYSNEFEEEIMNGYKNNENSLEDLLLLFSGVDSKSLMDEYKDKIKNIDDGFQEYITTNWEEEFEDQDKTLAYHLFNYLWNGKNPYNTSDDSYKLTTVIDNFINYDESKGIGNCVGLTSLYYVLATRNNLSTQTAKNEVHILSVLRINNQNIFIDHTDNEYGFDSDPSLIWRSEFKIIAPENLVISVAGHERSQLTPIDQLNLFIKLDSIIDSPTIYSYLARIFEEYIPDNVWTSIQLIEKGKEMDSSVIDIRLRECEWYEKRCEEDDLTYCIQGLEACSFSIAISGPTSSSYFDRANIYKKLHYYQKALNDYQSYIYERWCDCQSDLFTPYNLSAAYTNRGNIYLFDLSEYKNALYNFDQALKYVYQSEVEVDESFIGRIYYVKALTNSYLKSCTPVEADLRKSMELGFQNPQEERSEHAKIFKNCIDPAILNEQDTLPETGTDNRDKDNLSSYY